MNLADDTLAWELDARRRGGSTSTASGTVDTHLRLQEIARTRARRRGA